MRHLRPIPFALLLLFPFVSFAATPLAAPSLAPAPYAQVPLTLVSNGSNYLVLWSDQRSTIELPDPIGAPAAYSNELDSSGTPADPSGRRVTTGTVLAPSGDGYLSAGRDTEGAFTVHVSADGTPAGALNRLPGTIGDPLALVSNGTTYLLLHTGVGYQNIGLSILASDGTFLRSIGVVTDAMSFSRPWVLPNGAWQFVIVRWYCPGTTGCIASPVLVTVASGGITEVRLFDLVTWTNVAAAYGNGRIVIADQTEALERRFAEYRVFDTNGGVVHAPVELASTTTRACICGSRSPSVGWDGHRFLVTYQWVTSGDESTWDLRAVRVTSDGVLLDSTPMTLDTRNGTPPLFATNGTTTAVVWSSGNALTYDIYSSAVGTFDEIAGAIPHLLAQPSPLEREVELAAGPNAPLAVWREGFPNPAIVAARPGQTPRVIEPAGAFDFQSPNAAASKNAWLVVWREQHGERYSPSDFRILAKRVSFDGVPVDSTPIVVATDPGDLIFRGARPTLAVASDGNDWLVVYPASGAGIRAVRVGANGSVLDAAPIGLSQTFGLNSSPHAIWNGSQYIVLWTLDPRNPIILVPQPPASQIHETRVSAAGEFIDTKMLWSGGYGSGLAVAASPSRILLTWTVEIDTAVQGSQLNVMMLGKDGSPITAAQTFASSKAATPRVYSDIGAAWDGTSFVAAWTEQTKSSITIRYQHLDANGSPIEHAPLELEPGGAMNYAPSLVPNGSGVTLAFEMIAGEPYGDVARAFTTTLDRLGPFRRRVATR